MDNTFRRPIRVIDCTLRSSRKSFLALIRDLTVYVLMVVASVGAYASELGGIFEGDGSGMAFLDADAACEAMGLIACLSYQQSPSATAGSVFYRGQCVIHDPWADPNSGLDDDVFRNGVGGTEPNGPGSEDD